MSTFQCSFYKNDDDNDMLTMIEDKWEGDEQESNSKVQGYSLNTCISQYLLANSLLSPQKAYFR